MYVARVVGTVVATQKEPSLEGLKFLLLKQLDIDGTETGGSFVAADAVRAIYGQLAPGRITAMPGSTWNPASRSKAS